APCPAPRRPPVPGARGHAACPKPWPAPAAAACASSASWWCACRRCATASSLRSPRPPDPPGCRSSSPNPVRKEDRMKLEKVLYTAHATSTGGREGISRSDDGALDVKLSTPKGLGGPGGPGTNPEQLFAAGYLACFLNAMKFIAAQDKTPFPA